jgi:RHS repeat-associated protein
LVQTAYTPNGRVAVVTDGNSNCLRFAYDGLDRLRRETFADGSFQELAYDPGGNVTQAVTRAGSVATFTYDALNRLTSRTLPGSSITQYQHDLLGRLTNVTRGAEVIAFAYDPAGRLASVTDAKHRTVAYEYDGHGNRTRLTYPDGYEVRYAYDALNRLTEIREGGLNLLARYAYDALSRRTNVTLGNGVSTEHAYLADDSISQTVYRFSDGPVTFDYTYNTEGLMATKDVSHPEFFFLPAIPSGSANFLPNRLNQYASVGGQSYAYDLNGNLLHDGKNTCAYDVQNRLLAVSNASHTVQFAYDALGRRVQRAVDGTVTEMVHDGLNVLADYDSGGLLLRRYIHGPGLDDLVQMQAGGARFFFHQDRLHSVIALSDVTGQRVESFAYSPHGEPSRTSSHGSPYLFNGREYEAECGLYYHRARYYSPFLGRYTSADPAGLTGGEVNRYSFAGNNPANLLDPLGLCPAYDPYPGLLNPADLLQRASTMLERPIKDVMRGLLAPPMLDHHQVTQTDIDYWLLEASQTQAQINALVATYATKRQVGIDPLKAMDQAQSGNSKGTLLYAYTAKSSLSGLEPDLFNPAVQYTIKHDVPATTLAMYDITYRIHRLEESKKTWLDLVDKYRMDVEVYDRLVRDLGF